MRGAIDAAWSDAEHEINAAHVKVLRQNVDELPPHLMQREARNLI